MSDAMSRITKATSASGSAAGASSDAAAPPGPDFGEQTLRIKWGNVGGEIGNGERQIAGNAHKWTHAHDLMVADAVDRGNADHLARERGLFGRGQAIALVRALLGADTKRAAQRDFDPLRQ